MVERFIAQSQQVAGLNQFVTVILVYTEPTDTERALPARMQELAD